MMALATGLCPKCGLPLLPWHKCPRKRRRRPEHDIQQRVRAVFETYGADIYWMSQARPTMQTPGIADLIVFLPRYRVMTFWETKTPDGEQSPAQVGFQRNCDACVVYYRKGGVGEAIAFLGEIGIIAHQGAR